MCDNLKANESMTEYSIINKLKDQNKLNDQILTCINNLTLEDVIAVKLELSTNLLNHRLYGFDIWNKMTSITKEAVLKFLSLNRYRCQEKYLPQISFLFLLEKRVMLL